MTAAPLLTMVSIPSRSSQSLSPHDTRRFARYVVVRGAGKESNSVRTVMKAALMLWVTDCEIAHGPVPRNQVEPSHSEDPARRRLPLLALVVAWLLEIDRIGVFGFWHFG